MKIADNNKIVCIITQSHLCRNPRVLKEILLLASHKYTIHVLTSIYSDELLNEDKDLIAGFDIKLHFVSDLRKTNIRSLFNRLATRMARLMVKYLDLQLPAALGYGSFVYLKKSLEIPACLYICHQELPTFIGCRLMEKGRNVAFDFEDWYSEDLLPAANRQRPRKLLQVLERTALERGTFVIVPSEAMAARLAETYGYRPFVIYNVFPAQRLEWMRKQFIHPLKLIWFSQTIGPGRGIEHFITLLVNIAAPVELHLLGAVDRSYRDILEQQTGGRLKIVFHPLVPERELSRIISCFDIGLALELKSPLSRNYTITNKFFQYIQAGLPVIATATAGQQEAFAQFQPGIMLQELDHPETATALSNWLYQLEGLQEAMLRAESAATVYNWEIESAKLLNLIDKAIDSSR